MVWITATTISWFWKQSKIIQRIYSTILLNVWFDCVSYLRHICHKCCYHQRHKCVVWNLYPNDEVTKNSNISPSWNCGTIFKLLITYLLLAPKICTPIVIIWILYFCIKYWYLKKYSLCIHPNVMSLQNILYHNQIKNATSWFYAIISFKDEHGIFFSVHSKILLINIGNIEKPLKACTVLLITTQTQICFLIINKVTISVVVYNVSSTSLHLYLHKHVSQNNIQEPNSRRGRNTLNMSDLSVLLAREQYGRRRNKKFILWTTI